MQARKESMEKERPYSTPEQLVEGLRSRASGARAQLTLLLEEPLARLLGELVRRLRLRQDRDTLVAQALHLVETDLRTRPVGHFGGMTWPAFRAALLLQVARLAAHPHGQPEAARGGPPPLPELSSYQGETLFLPSEQVGRYWFGGDWYAGEKAPDGSLWVLVADITGHGYYAYLLACGLPGVWRACWEGRGKAEEPAELLALMHELLADCLPEGVYVECTLARLGTSGEVVVAPAGGSRLLLRRKGEGCPNLHKLRGTWLGLCPPSPRDQQRWRLEDGDEFLLGSDGLFDQLSAHEEAEFMKCFAATSKADSLLQCLRRVLDRALKESPQKDDITVVALRRLGRATSVAASAPPSPHEAGDVPV
jgi:hypothetical protein